MKRQYSGDLKVLTAHVGVTATRFLLNSGSYVVAHADGNLTCIHRVCIDQRVASTRMKGPPCKHIEFVLECDVDNPFEPYPVVVGIGVVSNSPASRDVEEQETPAPARGFDPGDPYDPANQPGLWGPDSVIVVGADGSATNAGDHAEEVRAAVGRAHARRGAAQRRDQDARTITADELRRRFAEEDRLAAERAG